MLATTKQYLKYLAFVVCIWFAIHTVYIYIGGTKNSDCTADAAVVLGNKIEEDGTPSDRLKARLDKALELYNHYKVKYIIVSGGKGVEGFFEGDKMRDYLISKGVLAERIIVDNAGINTRSTAVNTKQIAADYGFRSVTVVSQWFHISRCKLAFAHSGLLICAAAPNYYEWHDLFAVPREFIAYYRYLL